MDYTQNLNLPQFEASDHIHHDDFNDAFRTLDAMPRIATGRYTGDGTYGSAHPITLTFDFQPKVLLLFNCDGNSGMKAPMLLIAPYTLQHFAAGTAGGAPIHVTWGENTVSWYNENSAIHQFNHIYGENYYVALG